jgi:hypothetical protein
MKKKKKENNVLYAGIIVAVIAISFFSVYRYTDIFSTVEQVDALLTEYDDGLPELPEGYEYYKDTTDLDIGLWAYVGIYTYGGNQYNRHIVIPFCAPAGDLLGVGIVIKQWTACTQDLFIRIADEKPVNPHTYTGWLVEGRIDCDSMETDTMYYAYMTFTIPHYWGWYWVDIYTEEDSGGVEEKWGVAVDYPDGDSVDCLDYWIYDTDYGYTDYTDDAESLFFALAEEFEPEPEPEPSQWVMSVWWLGPLIIGAVGIAGYNYVKKK